MTFTLSGMDLSCDNEQHPAWQDRVNSLLEFILIEGVNYTCGIIVAIKTCQNGEKIDIWDVKCLWIYIKNGKSISKPTLLRRSWCKIQLYFDLRVGYRAKPQQCNTCGWESINYFFCIALYTQHTKCFRHNKTHSQHATRLGFTDKSNI